MSLLLDALRRAAASKQGPEADQYIAPRREDPGLEPDPDTVPTSPDEGAGQAGPDRDEETGAESGQSVERAAAAGEPAPDDTDFELSLEPETDDPPATGAAARDEGDRARKDSGRATAPTRSAAAATTLLQARGGGRRRGHGLVIGIGLFVVIATALAGGGWWYYIESRRAVEQGLAAYEPTEEPLVKLSEDPVRDETTADEGAGSVPGAESDAAGEGAGGDAAADTSASQSGAGGTEAPATGGLPAAEASSTGDAREQAGREPPAEATDSAAGAADDAAEPDSVVPAEPQAASAEVAEAEPQSASGGASAATDGGKEPEPRQAQPLVKTAGPSLLERALAAGYNALRAGDLETAAREYGRALKRDEDNRDALLGLASVAERSGDPGRAAGYYRRILTNDPRDPHARAGLSALAGRLDPRRSETELKQLLRDDPDSPFLNFALGNVYAGESRWGEAQQFYFRAYSAEPDNPEYAYNLAVALDHLQQRKAALEHYRAALARLDGGAAGFSVEALRQRIRQLE